MSESNGQESLETGQLLADRFRLKRFIDEGGLGQVWLAEDLQLEGAPVAVKVLKSELASVERAVMDLKREVLLTRRLRHPNILAIYTFWETDDRHFMTMEFVEGQNLAQALGEREQAFSLGEILPWVKAVAEALDYAHKQGVLHRDVKPGNVLLTESGDVRLADFGIARMLMELGERRAGGYTCGTITYMSPEQISGDGHGPQSDQYSLATVIYELLAGTPPFTGKDLMSQIQLECPPALLHLGESLNRILQKALSKKPEKRFKSCEALYIALDAIAGDEDIAVGPAPSVQSSGEIEDTVVMKRADTSMLPLRLGMLLLKAGTLSPEQLEEALEIQHSSGGRLGAVLVKAGMCTEEDIAKALSHQLKLPYSELDGEPMEREITEMLTVRLAVERQCIPLRHDGDAIVVAMADPLDLNTINELESTFDAPVTVLVATGTAVHRVTSQIYGAS